MRHEPDAELGLVRAYMQAGEYRRALGFAAHAAGAHRDEPAAAALYAWLLWLGGQDGVATALLEQARVDSPHDSSLARVRGLVSGSAASGSGADVALLPWLAPYPTPIGLAAAARLVGSGVLADEGRLALVPATLTGTASTLWLRNGLGQTVEARVERRDEASGVAVLRLLSPLPWPADTRAVAREAFAGSPGVALGYRASATPGAAWPLLRQGFFARVPAAVGPRPLGIDAGHATHGGPVFDQAGRLAGMTGTAPDGSAMLIPAAALTALGELPLATVPAGPVPIDAVYERGLRIALQLLVTP